MWMEEEQLSAPRRRVPARAPARSYPESAKVATYHTAAVDLRKELDLREPDRS